MQENWVDPWASSEAAERFDEQNKLQGWNLDEVKEEFDAFFAEFDVNAINDEDNEDRDKLDVALKNSLSLYNTGI